MAPQYFYSVMFLLCPISRIAPGDSVQRHRPGTERIVRLSHLVALCRPRGRPDGFDESNDREPDDAVPARDHLSALSPKEEDDHRRAVRRDVIHSERPESRDAMVAKYVVPIVDMDYLSGSQV
ncbi:hypothetical protein DAPPUDRAFT_95633 [Daphnia pulex]|uniref:Uncharacterized protein n=1 Tax=Daphnia pulex TaxID=6669 RepID=E9FUA2_DAPPU|nr:hypothetical protein DAPPUDRAFT_95633 [Daphnia pulex]|eukprot:EFX88691.1 hypothetical protein DAPPUDRAFT_95633 [Daphnia pulex]